MNYTHLTREERYQIHCLRSHKVGIATHLGRYRTTIDRELARIACEQGYAAVKAHTQATVAMTMMAACYKLKRLAKFLDDGVDAFYKPCPIEE